MANIKLTVSFILCVLASHSCRGQLVPVKDFDENEYICSYYNFEGVNLYATFDSDINEIKIYNSYHQLQSSLIFDPGNNYNSVQIHGLSKDVFNLDRNIEFLIYKLNEDGNVTNMVLLNDKNQLLQEFNSSATIRTIGDKNYIVESISETLIDEVSQQARLKRTDKLLEIKGTFRRLQF